MSSFDSSTHRLEGSGNVTGGLIIKKKKDQSASGSADDGFKKPSAPKGSLLGLDVLAKRKREEKGEGAVVTAEKKPRWDVRAKEREGDRDYDSDVRISFGRAEHLKVSYIYNVGPAVD